MTNPLFVGLLIAGVVLVIGVVLINWLQERRVRRRIDAAFRKPDDAARDAARVEPMFNGVDAGSSSSVAVADDLTEEPAEAEPSPFEAQYDEPLPQPPTRIERAGVAPDPDIECVVVLRPQQAVPTAALAGALAAITAKPSRWLGRRAPGLPWQQIDSATGGPWQELAACLLLANRAGAATPDEVAAFQRSIEQVAAGLPAYCDFDDAAAESARGEALDRLCADLDVQIGLTLLKSELGHIAGTRLRGIAEAAGFRLTPAGQFDYVQDDTGAILYSLQNLRQEAFTAESLRSTATPGVVFLLDVPRVPDPIRAFDQMRMVAKRMTQTLECVLVDDNRRPLNDTSLAAIRGQVQATAAALREANIEPGGPRALRLFG
ncbi:MAG: cell division protein ZipA C-terminal FtsZ-binding domain-containing protein [Casimicrobiaceae bacterium]